MKDAIAYLRSKNVPMDATWGSLQVAGDTGAPPIPLGGGLGDEAGNANALASRNPVTNARPLQADHLRLLAHPGDLVPRRRRRRRADDPDLRPVRGPDARRGRSDQTELFGKKQWVSFPFTPAQISSQQISKETVTG